MQLQQHTPLHDSLATSSPVTPSDGSFLGAAPATRGQRPNSLDLRTHSDREGKNPSPGAMFSVNVVEYPDGSQEASYGLSIPNRGKGIRGGSKNQEKNVQRASRRAAKQVRQRCMAIEANNMLTLTFRDNVVDFDQARSYWAQFARSMKKHFGSRWQFVVVLERQKRGAWHMHAAVHGFYPVQVVRDLWLAVVGQNGGNVDLQHKSGGKAWKVASYLTKYLTKSIAAVDQDRKRYSSSRNIKLLEKFVKIEVDVGLILHHVSGLMRSVGHIWTDDDGINGWLCSWSYQDT